MSEGREPSAEELPPPTLVEDRDALERMLEQLAGETEIAVDTEADSFFNYREKVCLIQVSAGGRDWLVDPLAGFDLAPFGGVLADPERTKIFHDGEFDVLILKRDHGFEFSGLFDTRVAAAALGVANPGLASVLEEHFGLALDKSQQRSDWSRRPLTERQVAYARLDTRYLVQLMHAQLPELEARDLCEVVDGECRRVEALEPVQREFNPDEFVRLKGSRALDPLGRSCLRELYCWRDSMAERRDVPPFKVVPNHVLVQLAERRPRDARGLSQAGGLSPKLVRAVGDGVLKALAKGRERGPLAQLPSLPPKDGTGGLDDAQHELHERLKTWRKERGREEGFDAALVLNRHVLVELARLRPGGRSELEAVPGLQSWQARRYGEGLLQLLERFERDLQEGRIEQGSRRRRRRRDS